MLTLYKKELNYYLNNVVGYLILIIFAAFANFLFVKDIFVVGTASMKSFFGIMPWLFLVFIPALGMRIFSEEKRVNTIEILLTLPVSETQIVLAKFFAMATLFLMSLALTLAAPISLALIARLYLPEVIVGYLGIFLLGVSSIAIAMFFSSQTKNQIVAFLLSVLVLFFLNVLATDFLVTVLPKAITDFASYFGPIYHLQNFIKGIVDVRSLFYFLSLLVVFLFLTVISLEKRD